MKLYLIRHGEAEAGSAGQPDSARQLTSHGRDEVASTMQRLAMSGVQPDIILTSPYARAMETAKLVVQNLGYKGSIVPSNQLVPHSSPEAVWEELRALHDLRSVFVTTHQPLVGNLVGFLLNSPQLEVSVKTASVIRIDARSGEKKPSGILRWMITPKIS